MSVRSVIVVTIDGLGAALLGPYGNTWASTPGFDRLAAESLLVEHSLVDSHRLESVFRSFWQGRHAACKANDQSSLAALCREHGVEPILISDDQYVLAHPAAQLFQQRMLEISESHTTARNAEQTVTARFFDMAQASITHDQSPCLLWVHTKGFSRAWDCPAEFRMALVDESDPDAPTFVAPPNQNDQPLDPDQVWALRVAYAAQLNLLDACLHLFLEQLHKMFRHHELLTIVTSPRAYPLGEHRAVGNKMAVLHGEQLHVPLMFRGLIPGNEPLRSQVIFQPPSLFGTIDAWLSLDAHRDSTGAFAITPDSDLSTGNWHRAVAVDGEGALSGIRTPGWYLRHCRQADNQEQQRVYAKPDDRWEINEIGDRVPDVAAALRLELSQYVTLARAEQLDKLPPLPSPLLGEASE